MSEIAREIRPSDITGHGGVRCLMSPGRSGIIYGDAATYQPVYSLLIPGGTIVGGSLIKLTGLIQKYSPFNAGWAWKASIGGVIIAQNTLTAAQGSWHFDHNIHISSDRKWGFPLSRNVMGQSTSSNALNASQFGGQSGAVLSQNPNGVTTQIAFASYSSAPIVETLLVNFDQDQTLLVELQVQAGDEGEFANFVAEIVTPDNTGQNCASSKATLMPGDSLFQGTGAGSRFVLNTTATWSSGSNSVTVASATGVLVGQVFRATGIPDGTSITAVSGTTLTLSANATAAGSAASVKILDGPLPFQFRTLFPGRPCVGIGLGGQIGSQIVDRVLSDPISGKYWDHILCMGTNDVVLTNGGADWWAIIKTQLDRYFNFRDINAKTIVCNLIPNTAWTPGSAGDIAVQYVNAQLAAYVPPKGWNSNSGVFDTYNTLVVGGAIQASWRSDTIHPTGSGYAKWLAGLATRMAALGWS